MSIVIYTRHALKMYNNGKAINGLPQHDSPIIDQEISRIEKTKENLIKQYGKPNRVKCSPFKRTRQTTEGLVKGLEVEVTIDNKIGEYLGNQRPRTGPNGNIPDVSQTTKQYGVPPLGEKFDCMKQRCREHLADMGFCDKKVENGVTWVVSHGLIIETIVSKLQEWGSDVYIPSNLDMHELDSIVIEYNSERPIITYIPAPK